MFVISWSLPPYNELTGRVSLSLLTDEEILVPKTVWLYVYVREEYI